MIVTLNNMSAISNQDKYKYVDWVSAADLRFLNITRCKAADKKQSLVSIYLSASCSGAASKDYAVRGYGTHCWCSSLSTPSINFFIFIWNLANWEYVVRNYMCTHNGTNMLEKQESNDLLHRIPGFWESRDSMPWNPGMSESRDSSG